MKKLPLLRQGQGFNYEVLNSIISAINELAIEQPGYDTMMNDLVQINNQYTTRIDSFIEQYRDVVENTPSMIELLQAYASLKEQCDDKPNVKYDISSLSLEFVKNDDPKYRGLFKINDKGYPETGTTYVGKGKAVVAATKFELSKESRDIKGTYATLSDLKTAVENGLIAPEHDDMYFIIDEDCGYYFDASLAAWIKYDVWDPIQDTSAVFIQCTDFDIDPDLTYKGSVETTDDLPKRTEVNDLWYVRSDRLGYVWKFVGAKYSWVPYEMKHVPFTDSKPYSWICIDTITGPQGGPGPQGKEGTKGNDGKDGEDGLVVKIVGEINPDATGDGLANILAQIASKLDPEKDYGKGYLYENTNALEACIFVYVGVNETYDGEPNGDKYDYNTQWVRLRQIRGPQGPAGKSKRIRIGYAVKSTDTPTENVDKDKNYYFLCIAVEDVDDSNDPSKKIPWGPYVRFRSPDVKFKETTVNWNYKDSQGKDAVYKTNSTKDVIGAIDISNTSIPGEQTIEKRFTFNFNDVSEVSEAYIDKNRRLYLKKKYKHAKKTDNSPEPGTETINVEGFIAPEVDQIITDSENAISSKAVKAALANKAEIKEGKIDVKLLPDTLGVFISGTIETSNAEPPKAFYTEVEEGNVKRKIVYTKKDKGQVIPGYEIQAPLINASYLSSVDTEGNEKSITFGWDGTSFVAVIHNLVLGESEGTAYPGNKGKQNANNISDIVQGFHKDWTESGEVITEKAVGVAKKLARDSELTLDVNGQERKFNGSSEPGSGFYRTIKINPETVGALPAGGEAVKATTVTTSINEVPIKDIFETNKEGKLINKVKEATTADNATTHINTKTGNPHNVQASDIGLTVNGKTPSKEKGTIDLVLGDLVPDKIDLVKIPDIPANKIITGEPKSKLIIDVIPDVPLNKITKSTGEVATFPSDFIPTLDMSKITTGTLKADRISGALTPEQLEGMASIYLKKSIFKDFIHAMTIKYTTTFNMYPYDNNGASGSAKEYEMIRIGNTFTMANSETLAMGDPNPNINGRFTGPSSSKPIVKFEMVHSLDPLFNSTSKLMKLFFTGQNAPVTIFSANANGTGAVGYSFVGDTVYFDVMGGGIVNVNKTITGIHVRPSLDYPENLFTFK